MSLRIAYTVNATTIAITDVVKEFVQNERMPIAATDNKINEKMNVWFFFIFYARLIIMILRSEPLTRFPYWVSPFYYSSCCRWLVGQSMRLKQRRR